MNETSRAPAVIGFLIAGALILGIGFLADRRGSADDGTGAPALRIVRPADSDTVRNPIELEFVTPAPLRLGRGGWTADDLHPHLMLNGSEIMPAAADIRVHGDGYGWRLPHLPPGQHTLYLTWAARHHGNLAGTSDTLRLHVLP